MSRAPRINPKPTSPDPLPDRPLEPPADCPCVAVRAAGNHPWIYRKMVIGAVGGPRPGPGDLVRVVDRDHVPIGCGLWNPRSQIAIRLLTKGDEPPPGPEFWDRRLAEAVALRTTMLGLDARTNAYRVVHSEGDGLSGLVVDRYGDVLSAEAFSLGVYQRSGAILAQLAARLGTAHALVQVDPRIAEAEDFPGRTAATAGFPPRVTIEEDGVRFRVQFEGGHKTGFFCDQRENRRALAGYCADRSVLDVCCYTGGFALHALIRGGAREVTGVDLDERAIALARQNANANQVRLPLVHADAFGYMRQMHQNGRRYGVVVLDPPKLIPTRLDVAAGKRKYFDLNVLALRLVEPGGLLLSCSCSGLLAPADFVVLLRAAARQAGRSVQLLALNGAAADHPVALDALEGAYLKAAWLRVGDELPPAAEAGPEPDDSPAAAPEPEDAQGSSRTRRPRNSTGDPSDSRQR